MGRSVQLCRFFGIAVLARFFSFRVSVVFPADSAIEYANGFC